VQRDNHRQDIRRTAMATKKHRMAAHLRVLRDIVHLL
jgi:hypothetical protein